jgi:ferredoxin-type protein NapH
VGTVRGLDRRLFRYARRLSQASFLIFFVLLVTGAVCSFVLGSTTVTGPLGAIQVFLASGILVPTLALGILVPLVLTLLLGRFFCSWICPMGSVIDLADWTVAKTRFRPRPRRQGSGDQRALGRISGLVQNKVNSYAFLGSSLSAAVLARYPAFCSVCPIGAVCRGVFPGGFVAVQFLVVGVVASLSLGAKRFWCRYLCPVGALLKITSRFNFFLKLRPNPDKCWADSKGCRACRHICPEGIRLFDREVQRSSLHECTKCFECYIKCPHQAIEVTLT